MVQARAPLVIRWRHHVLIVALLIAHHLLFRRPIRCVFFGGSAVVAVQDHLNVLDLVAR